MANHNSIPDEMSESTEMYLLRIALLQAAKKPVPVPLLAQELSVSPVSANEMCRKLTEKALLVYEPYKGVTLTSAGEDLARHVLRLRRLWEVFFVEKLSLSPRQAEDIACRFEHVTPAGLGEQLAAFLDYPALSPQNQPIPASDETPSEPAARPLSTLAAGEGGQIGALTLDGPARQFLRSRGVTIGATVSALALTADGALLLDVDGRQLSLAAGLAAAIFVHNAPAVQTAQNTASGE